MRESFCACMHAMRACADGEGCDDGSAEFKVRTALQVSVVCISSREGVDVRPGIRWGLPWTAGDRG